MPVEKFTVDTASLRAHAAAVDHVKADVKLAVDAVGTNDSGSLAAGPFGSIDQG